MELKFGDTVLCIKTGKMKNSVNKGRVCFKKGKEYKVEEKALMTTDELGVRHGLDESKWFKEHFTII